MKPLELYLDLASDCRMRVMQNSKIPGVRDRLLSEAKMWEEVAQQRLSKPQPAEGAPT